MYPFINCTAINSGKKMLFKFVHLESFEDNVYTYPHEIKVVEGSSIKVHFPSTMCVSEIEATVRNTKTNQAGTISIFNDGLHVSK